MIETKHPVILSVVPYKGNDRKGGYCIKHNQQIGWNGTTERTYGWFKYRVAAITSKNQSQKYYNDQADKNIS